MFILATPPTVGATPGQIWRPVPYGELRATPLASSRTTSVGTRLPEKKINADGTFETHAYDFSGRLVSTVDPMGRTVTYEHALDNRVTKRDFSDPATADVLFTCDALFPRLASRQDGAGHN